MRTLAIAVLSSLVLTAGAGASGPAPLDLTFATVFARTPLWGNTPSKIDWAPDGSRFTYVLPSQEPAQHLAVYLYDVATHRSQQLFGSNQHASIGDWSPHSRHVLVTMRHKLYVLTVANRHLVRLADDADDAQWSPAGSAIAFIHDADIWVISAGGGRARALTHGGKENVVQNGDAATIYRVPLNLEAEGLAEIAIRKLKLDVPHPPQLEEWAKIVERIENPKLCVKIALVGKYVELKDAYISISEAINHSGIYHDAQVDVVRVDSERIENEGLGGLEGVHGMLVAPGFGARGVNGKLLAIQYAREHKIPFLGICFGMQLACVEFARNVCGLADANTSEVNETTTNAVIDFLPDQRNLDLKGGTMRLGAYDCTLEPDSLAATAYGTLQISERHRHRYEFNDKYKALFEEHRMRFTGHHTTGRTTLVEVIELPPSMHPWFVGTQAHPEYKSRPNRPSPLYRDFIAAALDHAAVGSESAGPGALVRR